MKASTIQWHLARDSQVKLARFCESSQVRSSIELNTANDGVHDYWQKTFVFNNGGFITAEMLMGDENGGYSVADHFQIIDCGIGS